MRVALLAAILVGELCASASAQTRRSEIQLPRDPLIASQASCVQQQDEYRRLESQALDAYSAAKSRVDVTRARKDRASAACEQYRALMNYSEVWLTCQDYAQTVGAMEVLYGIRTEGERARRRCDQRLREAEAVRDIAADLAGVSGRSEDRQTLADVNDVAKDFGRAGLQRNQVARKVFDASMTDIGRTFDQTLRQLDEAFAAVSNSDRPATHADYSALRQAIAEAGQDPAAAVEADRKLRSFLRDQEASQAVAAGAQPSAAMRETPLSKALNDAAALLRSYANRQRPSGAGTTDTTPVNSTAQSPIAKAAEQTPVRIGDDIKPPTKVRHVPPTYPAMAAAIKWQGVAILEATIGTSGAVEDVKVLRSLGCKPELGCLLDDAAVAAVRQWAYSPTLLNGVPVPVIMTVTVSFSLQ